MGRPIKLIIALSPVALIGLGFLFAGSGTDLGLTQPQAEARFAAVAVGEILVFLAFLTPLLYPFFRGKRLDGWRHDCIYIGLATAAVVMLVAVLAFAVPRLLPVFGIDAATVTAIEATIFVVYVINVLGLTAAVGRTGGPRKSLFAPLIPAQMSAVLILELQREEVDVGARPAWVYGYLAVAAVAICVAYYWSDRIKAYSTWKDDTEDPRFGGWIVTFMIVGMGVSFLGYWLPTQEVWQSVAEELGGMIGGAP